MSTPYYSANVVKARADEQVAAQVATKLKKRSRWAIPATVIGVIAAGGAAFAAVSLFGFGSIDAEASTLKNLKVENARLTGTLAPGQSVGGAVDVYNENDFPVKVSAIILQDSSLETSGTGCDPASVAPGGSAGATYPGAGGGAGHQISLAEVVTIPAGGGKTITAANVVSQAGSASALCGVKADFAVVAAVGN